MEEGTSKKSGLVETALIREFNKILESNGSSARFDIPAPVASVQGLVIDANAPDHPISRLLTELVSKPVHNGCFYHYTSGDAAKSICSSRILRLTSIAKRLKDDELSEFLTQFDYKFPLQLDPVTGIPNFHQSIASRLFYASFTEINPSEDAEEYFWKEFAGDDGARLTFRFNLASGLLRRISYGDDLNRALSLFKEVKALVTRFGYDGFFWDDVGTVCALHLPTKYQRESEIRLIASRSHGLKEGSDGHYQYLEVPFGSCTDLKLSVELVEIQTNRSDLSRFGYPITLRP